MDKPEFNEQVWILQQEAQKAFDYIAFDDFYKAKLAVMDGDWSTKNIIELLMRANYNGAIARISYYKYVYKYGFDVRALWDALISTWMMNGVWLPSLDKVVNSLEFKTELKRFKYPKWVKFGLIGGSLNHLKKMGDEFCEEMERLE